MSDSVALTRAFADEIRQEIMDYLCCQWRSVGDIVEKLGGKVNQPTVSYHLKILEEAGLVTVRQEGRHRFYTLNEQQVIVCCVQLASTFVRSQSIQFVPVEDIDGGRQ